MSRHRCFYLAEVSVAWSSAKCRTVEFPWPPWSCERCLLQPSFCTELCRKPDLECSIKVNLDQLSSTTFLSQTCFSKRIKIETLSKQWENTLCLQRAARDGELIWSKMSAWSSLMAGQLARKLKGSPRRTASKQEMVSTLMTQGSISQWNRMIFKNVIILPL